MLDDCFKTSIKFKHTQIYRSYQGVAKYILIMYITSGLPDLFCAKTSKESNAPKNDLMQSKENTIQTPHSVPPYYRFLRYRE